MAHREGRRIALWRSWGWFTSQESAGLSQALLQPLGGPEHRTAVSPGMVRQTFIQTYQWAPPAAVDRVIDKALEFTGGRKPEKLMYSKKYMINRL